MKIQATYACGHDATFNFDGRNRAEKWESRTWAAKAASLTCPKCKRNKRMAAIRSMDPDSLRKILGNLIGINAVGVAIDEAIEVNA
jgi:hypothetical protein